MRQGQQQQQNRRGRGRNNNNNNNNNRKGQSPLTRSFESNGPDVKIRGTPSHIAEKYMALARDSMSSGDPVLAENYLQHAEHYNRIIMAFREQQAPNGNDAVVNGGNRFRPSSQDPFDGDDMNDEDGDELNVESHQPFQTNDPQPAIPAARNERSEGNERRERNDRPERSERSDRPERAQRAERPERSEDAPRPSRDRRANGAGTGAPRQRAESSARTERAEGAPGTERAEGAPGTERAEGAPRTERAEGAAPRAERAEPRRRERQRFGESGDQPDFLRRPVRRTRRDEVQTEDASQAQPAAVVEENQD